MATKQVHIANMAFNPDPVSINIGDTVEWVWDENNHSTTADDGSWDSGVRNKGARFPWTFPRAGNFPYYCTVHGGPGGVGMSSVVNVT
jgi:plastocyanin